MRREGAAACSRAEGARPACDSACARDGAGDACRLGEGRGARGSRRSGGRGSAARCAAARGEGSAEATTRFERRALLLQKEVSELLEAGALLAADLAAAAVELKTKVKLDSAQINTSPGTTYRVGEPPPRKKTGENRTPAQGPSPRAQELRPPVQTRTAAAHTAPAHALIVRGTGVAWGEGAPVLGTRRTDSHRTCAGGLPAFPASTRVMIA